MFSSGFLFLLVAVALTWTGAGALLLVFLLVRDLVRGELW